MLPDISFEIWLMVGIIGFYIADSVILSFHNEILLSASSGTSWGYVQHGSGLELAGKYLNVPHVFKPYQLVFKLRWQPKVPAGTQLQLDTVYQLRQLARVILPLQILVFFLALQVLILIPVIIYLFGLGLLFLIVLLTVYFTTLLALLFVVVKRRVFNLSLAACAKLAFDVLVCPPFSVNLLRKLGISQSVVLDGLLVAEQLLAAQAYQLLLQDVIKELTMMQVLLDDTAGDKYQQLEDYKQHLEQQFT